MNASSDAAPRTTGLGRGLSSLIPRSASAYQELACVAIEPNPAQPRKHFDDAELAALAESIAEVGVLQPVVVRELDAAGRYALIAGERRWRAAQMAKLSVIPAIVKQADDADSLVEAIVENVHRADLGPLEEAAAYRQLIDDFDLTHDQVGKRVGKSRATITNSLRLLNLPGAVQAKVRTGQLTAGHARVLAGLKDKSEIKRLAERVASGTLSVRDLERLANASADREPRRRRQRGRRERPDPALSAAQLEARNAIADALSTDVTVEPATAGAGKIVVRYADAADLRRIASQISRQND